ncbi:MAG: acetyl-CoA synthetase, partial [Syntrophobacterales bacterium CG23_combo_of_CG06-09_8_20_14_all_48_27]
MHQGIGFSKFVSTGNEADLHLEDYLEYLGNDEETKIIAAYVEGLREGKRFFRLAKEITRKKPIIVMKTGATEGSARAAKSHTASLCGSDAIYDAMFKQ